MYGATVPQFLIIKLTAPIFELANGGLGQSPVTAVGEIETPLPGLWIV